MGIILVGEIQIEFKITMEGFSYYFKVMFLSTSEHKMIAYVKNIECISGFNVSHDNKP